MLAPVAGSRKHARTCTADTLAGVGRAPGAPSQAGADFLQAHFPQMSGAPSDPATVRLLARIRADAPRGVLVTGTEAVNVDVTARIAGRLWVVIAFVVALSLLILTALLRAPVNALKAC